MLKILKRDKSKKIEEDNIDDVDETWISEDESDEGQLAVDVCQTDKKIIIQSTIAGVKPENLNISLNHDLLTIKGKRDAGDKIKDTEYLYQECYWGNFSRSVILPSEVDNKKIDAELENGVLTIILKKAKPSKVSIRVKN